MSSVYSVLQINKYIKNMISQDFLLGGLQVLGEVSNCKYHSSGHVYFTLKDENAAINCVMFAGNRAGLTFSMRNGDQVVVSGTVDLYEKTGVCQLYAKKIRLAGAGVLYEKFIALRDELKEMGMFAQEYKQPIPKHAKRIGVVTAPTGAAIRDIQNILRRRNPGIRLILFPALVQGEGAKESIVKGIKVLDKAGVDIIIVGRGGGSIEDLWAFNEEIVARAIFDCSTPVISAVGHETDWTIADYVADLRAPTPSAAAELAAENILDTVGKISEYEKRIDISMRRCLSFNKMKCQQSMKRIEAFRPDHVIAKYREKIRIHDIRIRNLMESELKDRKYTLQRLCGRLDDLSPLKRLSSGFSYVSTTQGKTLVSVEQVKTGDIVNINVKDGYIEAKAEKITPVRRDI